jgi:hypothetical protein
VISTGGAGAYCYTFVVVLCNVAGGPDSGFPVRMLCVCIVLTAYTAVIIKPSGTCGRVVL